MTTPFEEQPWIFGRAWSRSLPLLPVDRSLELPVHGVQVVVQPKRAHHSHHAELARAPELPPFQKQAAAATLHANLDNTPRTLGRPHHFHALIQRVAERLFDIDVLADGQ